MGTYILRRLLQMIPVVLGTTFLIYWMVFSLGDPTVGRCGERACPDSYVAKMVEEYHLDRPLPEQYVRYLGNVVQGDLGTSFNGDSVSEQLSVRWPTTIRLSVIAIVFETLIGIGAGLLAGLRRRSFWDSLVFVTTLLIISIPSFVLGSVAQLVFGVQLGWFPVTSTQGTWSQLMLPGFVLGSMSMAYIARLTRNSLTDNLSADYVRTARAKGLTRGRVVGIHTFRNSLIPVVTFIGADFGALMGGAVVTERIYNIQGIGGYIFHSIQTKDGTAVVGTITFLVIVFLIMNLIVDLLYGAMDPRIAHD
ncbi:ABC transporter permease [Brooklawnia cerclae]|uniref:Oligopeptide transport system permease protein n=1 Tax=Brooklawnia cerclae TaxID=349934 RepID=A0ABX0SK73_9ACTN|nr:ABC transporter permease [Brooklawnia cerclae]NIH58719.1 oligopeptide transport system permease protein [Brooklawnia cerclae]